MNANELTQRLVEAGETWSDLNSAASLMEELAKSVLAKIALKVIADGGSAAKAEMVARADEEYIGHVSKMVEARRKADRARVRWISGQAHLELLRTQEASKRAEMRLGGVAA